jgi:hypothetical protein
VDVLVISNALHERNDNDWSPPFPSAFTPKEIAELEVWIKKGGSLLLIVDHMPFPAAARELGQVLGVEFTNGAAKAGHWKKGDPETFDLATGLKESTVTRGRAEDEKVTRVATFAGSAFKLPKGATPVLVFGPKSEAMERKDLGNEKSKMVSVPIEGFCQGAIMNVGDGRVAVFAEAGMFTAQLLEGGSKKMTMGMNAPGAEQNYQLILNVLHWLSRAKGMGD